MATFICGVCGRCVDAPPLPPHSIFNCPVCSAPGLIPPVQPNQVPTQYKTLCACGCGRELVVDNYPTGPVYYTDCFNRLFAPRPAKPAAPQQPVRQQPVQQRPVQRSAPKAPITTSDDVDWGQSSAEEDLADSINAEFGPGGLRDRLNDELLKANLRSQLWASINDY